MTDTTKTGGQTRDTQAIDALIEAVRGGVFLLDVMKIGRHERLAYDAFGGSMDAALELMAEVTPDWAVDDMSENGRVAGHPWGVRLALWNPNNPSQNKHVSAGWGSDSLPYRNPARALLLATLKAWKETMK